VTTLEDQSFGFGGINIVNDVLNYFYLGLLMICFILALGNRPQGSKMAYTLAIIGFAVITIYMALAVTLLAYKCIEIMIKKHKGDWKIGDFLRSMIFRNLILSIVGTLGLYIFASVIFVSPSKTLSQHLFLTTEEV
jgi:chitin synthase